MSDEGFHEIQLNGKQLVFLFMAATVVSVVIFLCGVMVGRGVRAERGGGQAAEAADLSAPAATSATPPASSAPPSATPPTSASPSRPAPSGKSQPTAPPDPNEDDYYKSLTATKPADESLKAPAKPKPAQPPARVDKAAPPPVAASAPPAAEKTKAPSPVADQSKPASVTSGGFAVQITALRDRGEADAIVKRLVTKGYPAYVLNPLPGKPPVYRVQVGRYQVRGDADRVAGRLQKEEQFSPWVTR
jgi:cell division septation protein DedD